MDEEDRGPNRLGSPLRPLLTYGVPYVGAGVWAFTKFPEQLRWTSEVFARVFGLAAPFYEDLTHVEGYGEALDAAIDALERVPTRVLDLCCGTGFAARQIQHAFPDADVVGIDLSPEMILMARREADEEGLDIEFEVGDARALEIDDESFDLVAVHNAPPFPEETMRVLSPGGTALTVWSFGGPWLGLAWPALAKRLRKAGALRTDGSRAGLGFYGIGEKSGIPRRRRARSNGSAPPERAGARQGGGARRVAAPSRAEPAVPHRPPSPPPSAGAKARGPSSSASATASSRSQAASERAASSRPAEAAKRPTPKPRGARRAPATPPEAANGHGSGPSSQPAPPSAAKPSRTKRPAAKRSAKTPGPKPPAAPPPASGQSRAPRRPSAAGTDSAETPPGDAPS